MQCTSHHKRRQHNDVPCVVVITSDTFIFYHDKPDKFVLFDRPGCEQAVSSAVYCGRGYVQRVTAPSDINWADIDLGLGGDRTFLLRFTKKRIRRIAVYSGHKPQASSAAGQCKRRVDELEAQAAHIVRERVIEEEMDEFLRDAYARWRKKPHSGMRRQSVSER